MMIMRHYLRLNSFARCLVLSMVLHGVVAILLNLKSSITEITVGGGVPMITATLLPVTVGIPRSSGEKSGYKQLGSEPPPTANHQTPAMSVKKTAEIEKKSLETEKSPIKIAPVPAAQNKSSVPKLLPERLSVSKTSPVDGSIIKKTATTSKAVEKKVKVVDKTAVLKQSSRAHQSIDLDHFFDTLATRQPTSTVLNSSARQGVTNDQQCQHYAAQIKAAIQSNLIKESSYQGKSCEIALKLAADGLILQAQVRRGDPEVCAAALRAVKMTGSVPMPIDDKLYEIFKDIVISVEF